MAGYGIAETDIAKAIGENGIDPKTLRKHYRRELDIAHIEANAKVAESLFKKATGDGPQSGTCAIFWAKTRMGWKETSVQEHTGANGGPVRIIDDRTLDNLTDDEFAALKRAAELLAELGADTSGGGEAESPTRH